MKGIGIGVETRMEPSRGLHGGDIGVGCKGWTLDVGSTAFLIYERA